MFWGILMSDALHFGMETVRSLSDVSVFPEPLGFVAESLLERYGCVAQLSFGLAVVESVVALEIVYRSCSYPFRQIYLEEELDGRASELIAKNLAEVLELDHLVSKNVPLKSFPTFIRVFLHK